MSGHLLMWEKRLIEAGLRLGPLHLYGSAEWLALTGNDPRKIAACVRAAAAWRLDGVNLEQRLRDEVDAARAVHQSEQDAVSEALDGRVARIVLSQLPTQAQLAQWGLARDPDKRPALPDHLFFGDERRRWLGEAS